MDEERNLGVTEARFALTLLTCLLVAIGYVALLRLGGTKDTSVGCRPRRCFAAEHCRSGDTPQDRTAAARAAARKARRRAASRIASQTS